MLILGLCGGSGSGKNAVGAVFSSFGFSVLDTDLLYHTMIAADTPLSREIIAQFGNTVRSEGGGVDRLALSRLVFGDGAEKSARRALLNRISHTAVLAECRRWLEAEKEKGTAVAVINAPLLFESGFHRECDLVVAVLAPISLRIARIIARDGIDEAAAARRISAQLSDEYLAEHTDLQVYNDSTEAVLYERAAALAEKIETIAKEKHHGK